MVSFAPDPDAGEGTEVQVTQVDAASVPGLEKCQTASSVLHFRATSLSKPAVARLPHSAGEAAALQV